jgi:hypothetical protein
VDAKVRLVVFSGGESIGVDAMDNKWKIEVRRSLESRLARKRRS